VHRCCVRTTAGHGNRFFLEALDPEARESLKDEALERLVRSDAGEVVVTTRTVYCVARC